MKWISCLAAMIAAAGLMSVPADAQMMERGMGPGMMEGHRPGMMSPGLGMRGHGPGMMGGMCGKHMMKGSHFYFFMSREIGLSDKQITKLEGIKAESKKKYILQKAKIKVAKMELEELLRKDPVDMKKVEKKVGEITSIKEEKMLNRIRSRVAAANVLTKEQRTKAEELRWEKRQECMMFGPGRMGGGMGGGRPWMERESE